MRNAEIFWRAPSLAEFEREEDLPPRTGAAALFTATQRRLLGYLYGQPDRAFHMRELFALTGTGNGAIQRELRRLEAAGLVHSMQKRGRKFYGANPQAREFDALRDLVQHGFGLAEPLREAFACLQARIELMFVHEPVLPPLAPVPPLELFVVGTLAPEAFDAGLELARARLSRPLADPLALPPESFARGGWYLQQILAKPRIWVFGHEARLRAMTSGP